MRSFTAALVQTCAQSNAPQANLARAVAWVDRAIGQGAELVVLPEGYAVFGDDDVRERWAVRDEDPAACPALAPLAERTQQGALIVIAGGVPESAGDGRWFNTAFVLARGRIVARYRKIHLFDTEFVARPESATTAPGQRPVVVRTDLCTLGLSICYDLRFPELYRALSLAGADLLLVPSAFTLRTGMAHWEPLLRARAIESQAFVLAAAQDGMHGPPGTHARESFGSSMIVDPWGAVVARASAGEGIVVTRIDAEVRARAVEALPCLEHRRLPLPGLAELVEVVDARTEGAA